MNITAKQGEEGCRTSLPAQQPSSLLMIILLLLPQDQPATFSSAVFLLDT